jgi:hypothetical protein
MRTLDPEIARIALAAALFLMPLAAGAEVDALCHSECVALGYVAGFCSRHCAIDEATGRLRTGGAPGGYRPQIRPVPGTEDERAQLRTEIQELRAEVAALRGEIASLREALKAVNK